MLFAELQHWTISAAGSFWLAAGSLLVSCWAAVAADSFAEFSRKELEELCRRRKSPDRLGEVLRGYRQVEMAAETLQVLATALFVAAAIVGIWRSIPPGQSPDWQFVAVAAAGGILRC